MALHLLNLAVASPAIASYPIQFKLRIDGKRIFPSNWISYNSKNGIGSRPLNKAASASYFYRAYSHATYVKCKAVQGSSETSFDNQTVCQGIYGPWTVDSSDVREVILYRSGLVTAAASFVLAASTAYLPDSLSAIIKPNIDFLYLVGAGGLGLSLVLIHIYISTIKRTLQAFWALGILGSLLTYTNLAKGANETLVQYVLDHPSAIWLVGPLFAALTGLVFKEGLCYGKLEAGLLTFIIPTVLLGHLTNLMDDGVKLALLSSWMVLFVIFAGRKFTQPIKDDIGDKSVFIFNALPDDEKEALVKKLEMQKLRQKTESV